MTLQFGYKLKSALGQKGKLGLANLVMARFVMARFVMPTLMLALALPLLAPAFAPALAVNSDLPPESMHIPLLATESSVSTYVPSSAAEGQGIAVNVIYTGKARFKDGAPIAVVAPGGVGADGLSFNMHAAQVGAVEVRFAFPGGGTPQFGTKGTFDNRGARSIEAFRDVLLFFCIQLSQ